MKIYLDKELTREATIKNVDGVESVFDGNTFIGATTDTELFYSYDEDRQRIGTILHDKRKEKGITLVQMSVLAGITKQNLINIEKGKANFGINQMIRLLSVLDMPLTLPLQ